MKKIFVILWVVSQLMTSCNSDKGGVLLPTVTGAAYDLLIVGNPNDWKQEGGKALYDVFDDDTPGLPQSEPLFNISFIPESQFDRVLKPARNIVIFIVDDKLYTQGKISYIKNRWARIQAIIQITAPSQEELKKVAEEHKTEMIDFLVNIEYERSLEFYRRYSNGKSRQLVMDSVGIGISVPDFINKTKGGTNFAWLSNGSLDSRQDIVAYRIPYRGENDFSLERLLAVRDSIMKCYIEGPSEGSYMATELKNYEPVYRAMKVDNRYCVEIRGLWRVEGDFMGGPFVSRSYYDEKNNDIVTVETFVYAPQHKKRNKIRLMEAVTTSVEFE
ncbi:MAG: DUF4837 family protein [Paludibacteraceae bacterium]|nr:DUF4837 family protein [Paludibacteraceae bacterium]MBR2261201.1 DUF4837 family protein [Paludibacteraceae bacterium]MEE3484785.1 DUF4837 family protein [Bacteroidales bacterium]